MIREKASHWTELRPSLRSKASGEDFADLARALSRLGDDARAIEALRRSFVNATRSSARIDAQALIAAGLVLTDLAMQGWFVRSRGGRVAVRPPTPVSDNREAEKARIRRQELVKRDAQLRRKAVQKFLRSMERVRLFEGRFTSIFSLLRDG